MSGNLNPLHARIDRVDETTWRARQRIHPSGRRMCLEWLLEAREAALHDDYERVFYLCWLVEEKVRQERMWAIENWLTFSAPRHPRIEAWFQTVKHLERERDV
jgi:hypothetical protein